MGQGQSAWFPVLSVGSAELPVHMVKDLNQGGQVWIILYC